MDRSALRQALVELVEEEKGESYPGLEESTRLREELGLDSVDLVSLVMKIQDRFRVVLASEELTNIGSVGDLLDVMQSKLQAMPRAA
jgi:acyl carrier protein